MLGLHANMIISFHQAGSTGTVLDSIMSVNVTVSPVGYEACRTMSCHLLSTVCQAL